MPSCACLLVAKTENKHPIFIRGGLLYPIIMARFQLLLWSPLWLIDSVAVYIYPSDSPAYHLPVCVQGDGNCQCRAASLVLTSCLSVSIHIFSFKSNVCIMSNLTQQVRPLRS